MIGCRTDAAASPFVLPWLAAAGGDHRDVSDDGHSELPAHVVGAAEAPVGQLDHVAQAHAGEQAEDAGHGEDDRQLGLDQHAQGGLGELLHGDAAVVLDDVHFAETLHHGLEQLVGPVLVGLRASSSYGCSSPAWRASLQAPILG